MKHHGIVSIVAAGLAVCLIVPTAKGADPFEKFGNTGLDRKKPGPTTPSPFRRTPPAATQPAATPTGSRGIALANDWAGHLAESAGGQTMKIDDLRALLSPYGPAEADLAAHPEVTIYEGSRPGAPAETCRITYLMPLDRAEKLLFNSIGIVTSARIVAPGFPDGLFIRTYDIKAGIYNHLTLVIDSAKPVAQVVALQFKAEGVWWYSPTPFKKIPRDWHVFDYIGAANRGQSGIAIDTRVNDTSRGRGYLVVNVTGGVKPDQLPPPGIVIKPAPNTPKQTVTWYAPVPLVKLILYCLARQGGG